MSEYTMQVEFDGVRRDVVHGYELDTRERMPFDYYAWPMPGEWEKAGYPDRWGGSNKPGDWGTQVGWDKEFVRYEGEIYDLSDMERASTPGWDMAIHECVWWGKLFRYARPCYCTSADGETWGIHEDMCPIGDEIDTEYVFVALYLIR